ncbi:mandelate racemase/muconate lactonizing enzyme family protein [Paracidovorax anthurii]|uniref:L-alanine-DL-glutamate epimerase-like enolase superfamily enzyme n=1 Tax=Paracidovorax anthurii TaxID=78229 RepID=A0A328ZG04_9BURK|nr:mandelate racemase/muconate lactonizing enzyme family protein [Paracidovorax anthurii]RAR85138.1 L-alanine-DL-glutamate epimerase-like enolase superfamily enzyme [Paracidovorax anthurii]
MSGRSPAAMPDFAIAEVRAWPISFPVPAAHSVRLGVGLALKRDAVVVRVRTAGGLVGWGESHHGRAHSSIAHFINHALRPLVEGMDATDVHGVWQRIYRAQLAAMGTGAACVLAMSGIDTALWDIRAKAVGWPLYRLLGGASRPLRAYAGGVALGWQEPDQLVEEAAAHVKAGYKAVKLRVGDSVERDIARVRAVRQAFGDGLAILVDANCAYALDDARRAMPQLDELGVGWLEEPFPAHDYRSYEVARGFGRVAFAAGENHYTRFEFSRLVDDRVVSILQPDLSKTGGISETLRIAALASAYKIPVHPHSSMTGLNMAATLHVLAAIDGDGYFEADVSRGNLFRDALVPTPFAVDAEGHVWPSEAPGIGVEVDEAFLDAHPAIEGPAYA